MKRLVAGLVAMILASCSGLVNPENLKESVNGPRETPALRPDPTPKQPALDNLGPAPELENDVWLNTDNPLHLADLRGRVILLDMWTFG